MRIVGVTKCPTGIAHTYMAAERMELLGEKLGYEVRIETQGSQGTEHVLTKEEIAAADYVIIAADIAIDGMERFAGKKVYRTPIKPILRDTARVFQEMQQGAVMMEGSPVKEGEEGEESGGSAPSAMRGQTETLQQLMNGASHMIPFVVVGGMFFSFSLGFGGESALGGLVFDSLFWDKINQIASLAFALMYPILTGFFAFSIAGRASLAPAMIGAMIATDGEILGTGEGTGFLGCIVVGFLVGHLVRWMNTWKVPKEIKPMMPIFIIPLCGVSVIAVLFIGILGHPIAAAMQGLNALLVRLADNPSTAVLLGVVLGAMIGVDMGGPINKIAFFFGVTSIAEGNTQIMGIVSAAIAVAPLSMGLAALIGGRHFTKEERGAGIYTIFMGAIGISEGALPFAIADPRRVIPAVVVGSAAAGAAASVLGVTSAAPHGGLVIALLGATNQLFLFSLSIFFGTAISTALVLFLKRH